MKKIYSSLVICLIFSAVFSQEKIASLKNHLKINSTDIKDVIPIVNSENNEIAIFIADAKNVYGYKLNDKFKVNGEVSSITKKRKYKVLLGSSIHANNYKIYLTNKDKNKYAYINFSFDSKENSIHEFILPPRQRFIQTISYKNKLYVMSADKVTRTILLNYFDNNDTLQHHIIDTTDLTFLNKDGKQVLVIDLLLSFNNRPKPIKKFEKDTPNSIETVSETNKLYLRNNEIVITFDKNKDFTQVLSINIDSFKTTKNSFKKPLSDKRSGRKKTNSFIYDDKIILVAATKDIFSMQIFDYDTGKLLKEYAVNKDEEITFKNSPIIQKGGFYNNHRELKKTKQFLRKITSNKIGVSVIKNKNNFHFSIGGYVEQRTGGPMMMGGFGGIPMASFGNISLFFNPTMFAYNSFSNTKSTQIECLFNENFEYIKDAEPQKNAFNIMKDYPKKGKTGITVFKHKDYFIRGAYNSSSKTYYLTKFER
ncbi:hypothetical protein [Tenacibaculum ovolyticum]|uniref:hypothetical protein n=1 Tax=Tenacibaculum ovolyticum TaxID=104270 RepID=UPI0007EC802E|nr:hypothetical protein [Tenacibaculum ovolyticum]